MINNLTNWFYFHFFPNFLLKRLSNDSQRRVFFVREYQLMVQRMWRGEFIVAKKKEIREDIRRQYDKVKEDIENVKNALKIENEKLGTGTKEKIEERIGGKEKDIAQFKEQIDGLDKELMGVDELLKGYREGLELLKSIINQ